MLTTVEKEKGGEEKENREIRRHGFQLQVCKHAAAVPVTTSCHFSPFVSCMMGLRAPG